MHEPIEEDTLLEAVAALSQHDVEPSYPGTDWAGLSSGVAANAATVCALDCAAPRESCARLRGRTRRGAICLLFDRCSRASADPVPLLSRPLEDRTPEKRGYGVHAALKRSVPVHSQSPSIQSTRLLPNALLA